MTTKYLTSLKKIFSSFQNRNFSKQVATEKSKKYLVNRNYKRTPFLEFYNRARRGAYLRPFYSAFQNTGYDYRIIFGVLGVFMILASIYIILFSKYFQILPSRVIIERNDTHSDINIAYRSIEGIYGRSLWFIEEDEITEQIRNLQKNIETVKIDRVMPNILRIIIQSSPLRYSAVFQGANKTYHLSENGVLIPSKSQDEELKRLTIHSVELSESPYLDYKEAIPPLSLKYLTQAENIFSKEFPVSTVTSVSFFVIENEFHLLLENGTRILLVCDSSLEKQLLGIKIGLENIPGLLSTEENYYIDARILGKLFVCKDPVLCQRNLNKLYGK